MRHQSKAFDEDIARLPNAIKTMMKRDLEPLWSGMLNPCDGVIKPTVVTFNRMLNDTKLDFGPWCPQGIVGGDASRCIAHLNQGAPLTVYTKEGFQIQAKTNVNICRASRISRWLHEDAGSDEGIL